MGQMTAKQLIIELFEEQVRVNEQHIAVVYKQQSLTYGELNQQANKLAHYLEELGVAQEVLVAIGLPRSPEMLIAILGVLKAGGAYLALDCTYPKQRLKFILQDSQAPILLTQSGQLDTFDKYTGTIIQLDKLSTFTNRLDNLNATVLPSSLAYVLYTSGSTGLPKGVMIEHQSLNNYLQYALKTYELSTHKKGALLHSSIAFDLTVTSLFLPLIQGGVVYMAAEGANIQDIAEEINSNRNIGLLKVTPSHLRALEAYLDPNSLKDVTLIVGGEALLRHDISAWVKIEGIKIFNEYGPTEATVGCSVFKVPLDNSFSSSIPIGQPIDHTELYLLDKERKLVAPGKIGEIGVAGVGVARGYLHQETLTKEKFIPNLYISRVGKKNEGNDKIYLTGDLGRQLPDGSYEFCGREDNQLKIKGYRVELQEIETAINDHGDIVQSYIKTFDHLGTARIIAYVVAGEFIPSELELKAYLEHKLPSYMIPSFFVFMDKIPLTANGKVNKDALPLPELSHAGTGIQQEASTATELEQTLKEIWIDVLKVKALGRNDNFYSIGGDSIISMQLIAKARQRGLHFTVQDIFKYPTIAKLALCIKDTSTLSAKVISQDDYTGLVALSPIQIWFFQHDFQNKHHFNQAIALKTSVKLNEAILEQALLMLVDHHKVLQYHYEHSNQRWQQLLVTPHTNNLKLEVINLHDPSPEELTEAIYTHSKIAHQELDITHGKLIKALLFKSGINEPQQLLIIIHHLVVDTVSWRILIEDLEIAYTKLLRGEKKWSLDKGSSYRQWINSLKIYATSEELQQEKIYWRNVEKEIRPVPEDFNKGPLSNRHINAISVSLTREETTNLLQSVHQAFNTQINDILVTALVLAIVDWSHCYHVSFCLEGHGREEGIDGTVDLSRTIGWFTSLFPINISLQMPCDNLGEVIKTIKEVLRAIPKKGVGYGLLHYIDGYTFFHQSVKPNLIFNYLGQWDNTRYENSIFQYSQVSTSEWVSKDNAPFFPIEVNSEVKYNILNTIWIYSTNHFRAETMQEIALLFQARLRRLIQYCCEPSNFGYTTSDFKLAPISQEEIDISFSRVPHIEDVYPLSSMQAGILFHKLYSPESNNYFVQTIFKISGQIDSQILQQACQEVCNIHPILRTGFIYDISIPVQYVIRELPIQFEVEDWVGLPALQQQMQLDQFLIKDQEKGFELNQAPLIRFSLIQADNHQYYFCISQHHILLDGWSSSIILNDIFNIYEAIRYPKYHMASTIRPPFRNYIEWKPSYQYIEETKNFWKSYLSTLDDVTYLGFKDLIKEKPLQAYDTNSIKLTSLEYKTITAFASERSITLSTLILAAVTIVLKNYVPQQELVIGITVSGRNPEVNGVADIAGLLINTLPLRIEKDNQLAVLTYLKKLQDTVQLINKYSYLALAEVQSLANTDRHLFNTIFVFEKFPLERKNFTDFSIEEFIGIENTEYPLTITALQGETLEIILNYQTAEFNKALTTYMLGSIYHVLFQIIQDEHALLSNIDTLGPQERNKVTINWNSVKRTLPSRLTLNELFEEQASKTPDNIALVCNGEALSYQLLNERANQLAHYLRGKGVTRETLVAIFCERSIELIVGILAVLKAGGAYIPIDPSYPQETLLHVLDDSRALFLLTQQRLQKDFSQISIEIIYIDTKEYIADSRRIRNLSVINKASNLAYIIYTSGSTGKPKGVMVEHISACCRIAAYQEDYPLTEEDIVLCQTSAGFDVSVAELFWTFSVGAKVVLSTEQGHEHLLELESLIFENKVTFAQFVPSALKIFLEYLNTSKNYSLQCVCSGGEVLEYNIVKEFRRKLPHTILKNAYGPTEATIDATMYNCSELSGEHVGFVPIGRPLGNTEIYILNESKQPVPIGVIGEIYIGGPCVARGYINNASLTESKFIHNPFIGNTEAAYYSDKLYRTGDLGRWLENGILEYVGRTDNQVKIRGYRIELQEIEEVLLKNFTIRNAIVVAQQDTSGNKQLIAYIVSREESVNVHEMKNRLKSLLPSHMIPNDFINLPSFPLTRNGKVDRQAIAKIKRPTDQHFLVNPRTELERALCEIWKNLLGQNTIGIQDNFFFLGGNSIVATQLILDLRKKFSCSVSFVEFFNDPTIESLARLIEGQPLKKSDSSISNQVYNDIEAAKNFLNSTRQLKPGKSQHASRILLTGASGFLGIHLLAELLDTTKGKIYCLLRGKDIEEAKKKFKETLKYYALDYLYNNNRIVIILGDLGKPKLGLADNIYEDIAKHVIDIYHNGALVHHLYDYARLRQENVQSTIEILRLASLSQPKNIHFISTLSAGLDKDKQGQIVENFVTQYPTGNEGGYTISKWVSEKILADAIKGGFNVTIHRLPQVMGHSVSGITPYDKVHIMLLMKSWVELGVAPEDNSNFNALPVDFVAKSVVKICSSPQLFNKVFNYSHPAPISFSQIITWLNEFGYSIDLISKDEWRQKCASSVKEGNSLYPLLALYMNKEIESGGNLIDSKTVYTGETVVANHIQALIKENNWKVPALDKELFFKYFSYLQNWFDKRTIL